MRACRQCSDGNGRETGCHFGQGGAGAEWLDGASAARAGPQGPPALELHEAAKLVLLPAPTGTGIVAANFGRLATGSEGLLRLRAAAEAFQKTCLSVDASLLFIWHSP